MNKERFFAANAMALITHTIVRESKNVTFIGSTLRFSKNTFSSFTKR